LVSKGVEVVVPEIADYRYVANCCGRAKAGASLGWMR
jgi:hypothetical protein